MNRLKVSWTLLVGLVGALVAAAFFVVGVLGLFTDADSVGTNSFATANCFADDTGWLSPTAEAADSGGDGDGFELNPTSAFGDGGGNATNNDGDGDRQRYYDYGISISSECLILGIEVQIDWWLDSDAGTNSVDVELSRDGGSSWTLLKTDTTETTTEHTAILGSATDTWGASWTVTELNDANFRVRVTSNSSNSSRDFFLDWVPVKIYYGTCNGADSGFLSATTEAADTGGNGDGFELNPANAFGDDSSFADNIDGPGDRHRYYNYSVAVPSGCSAAGIEVRLDWYVVSSVGMNSMSVELSWDGGSSWTSAKTDSTETETEHTATLGGSADTWGRSWTAAEFSDANFRVRLTSNSDQSWMDFFLDWVPVKIHYAPS